MSEEYYKQIVDDHRLSKLIELCVDHNNSIRDSHPKLLIDLDKYTAPDYLILNLIFHDIDTGVLGFGYPYDDMLTGWVSSDFEDSFEGNMLYLIYTHSDKISSFLFGHFSLAKELRWLQWRYRYLLSRIYIK